MTSAHTASRRFGGLAAAVVAIAQWPLFAIAHEPWTMTNWVALALVMGGTTPWLLGRPLGGGGYTAVLVGSLGLTAGLYLAFRSYPLLPCLVLVLILWIVTTGALVRVRAAAAKLSLLATGLAFVAVLLEGLASWSPLAHRFRDAPDRGISVVSFTGRIESPDPQAERQLVPSGSARHRKVRLDGHTDFDVAYHTDGFGSRVVPGRPSEGRACYMFGCSFTFGEGVEDDQTIAAGLQRLEGDLRVFNFGIRDGGTSDAWIHLTRRLDAGERPAWSIYSFMYDHFRRTAVPDLTAATQGVRPLVALSPTGPVYRGRAEILTGLPVMTRLRISTLKRSRAFQLIAGAWTPDDAAVELVAALGNAMDEGVRTRVPGGRFLFVFLPSRSSLWDSAVGQLKDRLRSRGVPVLECDAMMAAYARANGLTDSDLYLTDGHPTARYDALIAEWISRYISGTEEPATSR